MSHKYLTAPVPSKSWPKGIPYIIGNETAERFSFYGMKGILVVFMTAHLLNSQGEAERSAPGQTLQNKLPFPCSHAESWGLYKDREKAPAISNPSAFSPGPAAKPDRVKGEPSSSPWTTEAQGIEEGTKDETSGTSREASPNCER